MGESSGYEVIVVGAGLAGLACALQLVGMPVESGHHRMIGFDLRPLVTNYRIVNEVDEFYALSPGQNSLRPEPRTPVPGLALAGGYTKQPWVDTMEGAVISGQRAAEAVLASL